MRLNALWWWIDRWRKSTAYTDMTLEEQGAYRNLLDEANLRGGALPNDERILAKACGDAQRWKRVRPAVMARFELKPDGWRNETLDLVIAESKRRSQKQSNYRNRTSNSVGNETSNAARPHLDPETEIGKQASSEDPEGGTGETATPRTLQQRAGAFCEWYEDAHQRIIGVGYMGSNGDYVKAQELCQKFNDEELRDAATVWFGMNDRFATHGTRTIPKFASRASACVLEARRVIA